MSAYRDGVDRSLLAASIDSAALDFCLRVVVVDEETASLGYAPSRKRDSRRPPPFLAAVSVSEPRSIADSGESGVDDVLENWKLTDGDLRRKMTMKMKKRET